MIADERTPRQRIKDLLFLTPLSAGRIAEIIGMSERQVEDHLRHIVKTVAQDRTLKFILDPPTCKDCDFVFRDRSRLTRPSRCPRCHSEAITEPRYSIEHRTAKRD
jgi:predicted Zn-ribbon and HTH transcriptional regulator